MQEKGIVLQLGCVMGRNCIAIHQSVLQEYAVVRLYCSMRKCIAIGGLKEELYCKIGIVLQIGWNCIARQHGATGSVLQYNYCIVTNSNQ